MVVVIEPVVHLGSTVAATCVSEFTRTRTLTPPKGTPMACLGRTLAIFTCVPTGLRVGLSFSAARALRNNTLQSSVPLLGTTLGTVVAFLYF